ncbi:hypothetical protein [Shewanella sp. SM78]|uniref:hypothetical protein n=1 Tax=Shewanella sp. SM78 TaxID=2912810 RepID=UPI0021D8B210|nr:hypothetical protein [Shewanella sp. SM78]MCU8023655.1 hypothetical protein [Shewanella sp. SM78]
MKNTKYIGFSLILICSTPALSEPLDFYGRLWLGVANSSNGLSGNEKVDGFSLENYASYLGVKGEYSAEESPDDLQINHQIRVEAHLVA